MIRYFDMKGTGGPFVGIMTARKKNGSIAGNGRLFIELQKKLISINGISFIFTLDGVTNDSINGYMFLLEEYKWEKINVTYPDLVYNRIPFRQLEQDMSYHKFLSRLREKKIPVFNPKFIDKYELYSLLNGHSELKKHLPDTILAHQREELSSFLNRQKSIYLKPRQSARGKGIFRIRLDLDGKILLESMSEKEIYPSFDHFWKKWEKIFNERNYLAQEEIKSALFEGKRFDFRILAHAQQTDYIVTGIGIRQSQDQEITTHIPTGGRFLPYQLFQTPEHDQFIETAVSFIGKALSERFGFFGEFSIDLAISDTGQYYLYEVNSKPMSFDETEIEERKIERLCQLFLELTGFQNNL